MHRKLMYDVLWWDISCADNSINFAKFMARQKAVWTRCVPDDKSHTLCRLSHCTSAGHTSYEHTGKHIHR